MSDGLKELRLNGAGGPAPWMGFGEAVRYCLNNYATFSGRGSRSQYWFFALFLFLVNLALAVIDLATGATSEPTGVGAIVLGVVYIGVTLALFIPSLAATSRRFHDAGWSFWWFLVIFIPLLSVLFVFYLTVIRDPGPNRFDKP